MRLVPERPASKSRRHIMCLQHTLSNASAADDNSHGRNSVFTRVTRERRRRRSSRHLAAHVSRVDATRDGCKGDARNGRLTKRRGCQEAGCATAPVTLLRSRERLERGLQKDNSLGEGERLLSGLFEFAQPASATKKRRFRLPAGRRSLSERPRHPSLARSTPARRWPRCRRFRSLRRTSTPAKRGVGPTRPGAE